MANTVGGSVVWDLDVDDKKLTAGLSNAEKAVASTAKTVDSSSSGMANSLTNAFKKAEGASMAFTAAIGGIGAGIAAAAGFAVKSAADMEMLRTSLDTLTGSAKNGEKIFKDLFTFASTTPFEVGDLAKATQTMLAFGIETESVIPNLKMLGDISLGDKNKLGGLSLAFSQVASTGRLMGQDLLQLINAGFNPLTIISQKTGKSMSALKKEMEQGAISFDMVKDAMVTATSKGGVFFEGMKKGSQTLQGVWSTFNDTVGTLMRNLVGLSNTGEVIKGGFVDKIKNALVDLSNFLSSNQSKIVSFFNDTIGWIIENGPVIAGIIAGGMLPAFVAFAGGIIAATVALAPFLIAGAAVGATIKSIIDEMGGLNKISGMFQELGAKIKPGLDDVVNQIRTGFDKAFSTQGSENGLLKGFTSIGDAIKTVANTLSTLLKPVFDTFMKSIAASKPQFDVLLQQIGPLLVNGLKILGTAFVAALGVFSALVNGISTALPFIIQLFTGFTEIVNGIMKIIVGIFTLNWKLIWDGVKTTVLGIKDVIVGVFGSIISFIAGFIKGFIDYFKNLYNVLVGNSIVPDMVKAIVAWIAKLPGMIYDALSGLVSGFANIFKNAWNAVSSQVSSWISQASAWAQNIAKAFVDGFSQLGQWLKDKISSALNAAKSFLEGQSPPVAGPFKDIDKWGFNVGIAWVEGVNSAVSSLSLPANTSPSLSTPSLSPVTLPSTQPSMSSPAVVAPSMRNQEITVNIERVNSMSDVDKISREVGFKLAVV